MERVSVSHSNLITARIAELTKVKKLSLLRGDCEQANEISNIIDELKLYLIGNYIH